MSDGAVASLVSALVTVTTMVIGFLTLWVKLKYGTRMAEEAAVHAQTAVVKAEETASAVSSKLDENTALTVEAKEAATKASEHAVSCDEEKAEIRKLLSDHESRIVSLEAQIAAMKVSVDGMSKNIDSSRHEMRGHLQTLTNKLDLIGARLPRES